MRLVVFEERDYSGTKYIGLADVSYATFREKQDYPWCLNFCLFINTTTNGGLPNREENERLQRFEQELLSALCQRSTIRDVAHVSGDGRREYWWYLNAPEAVDADFAEFFAQREAPWKGVFAVSRDERWAKVLAELLAAGYTSLVYLPLGSHDDGSPDADFNIIAEVTGLVSLATIASMRSYFTIVAGNRGGRYDGYRIAGGRLRS